jgi:hypothetical protein
MRRISTIWIAAILLAPAASMSPGRLACQAPSITLQEPPTLGEFFRVDRATGAPTPPSESSSSGPGSTESVGSAYRAPSLVAAQNSPSTAQDKARSIAGVGANSCVRISNFTSNKTAGGLLNGEITDPFHHPFKTSQYVRWWAGLDSTACKNFPFVVRLTVHQYQDQGATIEVPFPPGQETTLDFLIERNESITVDGAVGVSPKSLKESHFTGVHAQIIVAHADVKALQEAQLTDPRFCEHYAGLRYTGKMTRYGPELVPDSSFTSCMKAQSAVMAERFMNEHADVSSITKPILCADPTCVQDHLDNTVPNATNVSKFIEGSNVYKAVRTFENVNATCEKCRGNWTATGIMNQAMHISGSSRPDYDEADRYDFTCKTDTDSVIPKGQIVAGKHSANDSNVTCSAQKIQ